jgi:hypothetical protein
LGFFEGLSGVPRRPIEEGGHLCVILYIWGNFRFILTMVWDGVGLGPKGRGFSYEQLSRGVGVN